MMSSILRSSNDALTQMLLVLERNPGHRFGPDEVVQWAGRLDNEDFFNEVALEIAIRFQLRALDFTVCDGLVNDLWRAVLLGLPPSGGSAPEPFYSIFLAFDEGEYFHKRDRTDDPIADHTDPQIAEILREHARDRMGEH